MGVYNMVVTASLKQFSWHELRSNCLRNYSCKAPFKKKKIHIYVNKKTGSNNMWRPLTIYSELTDITREGQDVMNYKTSTYRSPISAVSMSMWFWLSLTVMTVYITDTGTGVKLASS